MFEAIKKLFAMALAMVTTRFTQTLRSFIVMVMLAQLGHTVLAASLQISIIQIVVMLVSMSPLFALGSIMSRQYTAEDRKALASILWQGIGLAVLLSLPGIVIYAFIGTILQWLHQPAILIPYVATYFHIMLWGMPAIMVCSVLQQFVASTKHQRKVIQLSVLSLGITLLLSYGLIFGRLGLPAMGVAGAALAMVLRAWLMTVAYALVVLWLHRCKTPLWPCNVKGQWHWSQLILKVGTPIGLQIGSEMLVLAIYVVLTGWLGVTVLAASQVANEYVMFVIVPIFGLAEASAIVVGHGYGERDFAGIRRIGHASVLGSVAITVAVAVVFALFHRPLADVFVHFGEVDAQAIYHLAMWILALRIFGMLFMGVIDVTTGALRGLYDTAFPMFTSLAVKWLIGLPLSIVLAFPFHMGVIGLVVGSIIAAIVSAGVLLWRWERKVHQLGKQEV